MLSRAISSSLLSPRVVILPPSCAFPCGLLSSSSFSISYFSVPLCPVHSIIFSLSWCWLLVSLFAPVVSPLCLPDLSLFILSLVISFTAVFLRLIIAVSSPPRAFSYHPRPLLLLLSPHSHLLAPSLQALSRLRALWWCSRLYTMIFSIRSIVFYVHILPFICGWGASSSLLYPCHLYLSPPCSASISPRVFLRPPCSSPLSAPCTALFSPHRRCSISFTYIYISPIIYSALSLLSLISPHASRMWDLSLGLISISSLLYTSIICSLVLHSILTSVSRNVLI